MLNRCKLILLLVFVLFCGCQSVFTSSSLAGSTPPQSGTTSSSAPDYTPGAGAEGLVHVNVARYPFREEQEEVYDVADILGSDLTLTLVHEKAEQTSGYPITYAQQEKIMEQTRDSLFLFWLDASKIKIGWDDVGVYELNGREYYRTRLYSIGEDFGHWVGDVAVDVALGTPWIWKGPNPPFSIWQAPMAWQGNSERLSTNEEAALLDQITSFLAQAGETKNSNHDELHWIVNHYLLCRCATPETCEGPKCSAVLWYGYDPGSGEVWRDDGGSITSLGTLQ